MSWSSILQWLDYLGYCSSRENTAMSHKQKPSDLLYFVFICFARVSQKPCENVIDPFIAIWCTAALQWELLVGPEGKLQGIGCLEFFPQGRDLFTPLSLEKREQRPQENLGQRGIFLGESLPTVQLLSNEHSFRHPQDDLLQESHCLPRWWPKAIAKQNFILQNGHISPTRVGIQHVQGANVQLANV